MCFHNEFNNPKTIEKLKYCRGLKYFLPGCIQSQKQIIEFISKCKKAEDNKVTCHKIFIHFVLIQIINLFQVRLRKIFLKLSIFKKAKLI